MCRGSIAWRLAGTNVSSCRMLDEFLDRMRAHGSQSLHEPFPLSMDGVGGINVHICLVAARSSAVVPFWTDLYSQ